MKTRVALAAANLAVLAFFLLSWTPHGASLFSYRLDLDVYRIGGRVWLNGGHLYDALPATAQGIRLPFTYPPFAAIVSAPLSLIPLGAAGLLITLCTITLLVVPLRIYLRRLDWPLGWVLPVALFLEPVRSTIQFGQVNVVLMALVTADCLSRAPRWPRGSLTGLAAAVKLTPLPFVLFFLLRRDYRAAGVMGLSFAACTGLGLVLAPGDSMRYWTSAVYDIPSRIGNPAYAPNQSIVGVLARAGLHPGTPAATSVWLTLSTAVLTVACLGMRRAIAAGDAYLALVLNAFASLLVSPISWSHHWVWAGPAVLALAAAGRDGRLRTAWLAAVSGLVIFVAAPQWWFDREPHWPLWQQAVGDSYVLFAASVLIMSARMRSSGTADVATPAITADSRRDAARLHLRLATPGSSPADSSTVRSDRGWNRTRVVIGRRTKTVPPGGIMPRTQLAGEQAHCAHERKSRDGEDTTPQETRSEPAPTGSKPSPSTTTSAYRKPTRSAPGSRRQKESTIVWAGMEVTVTVRRAAAGPAAGW